MRILTTFLALCCLGCAGCDDQPGKFRGAGFATDRDESGPPGKFHAGKSFSNYEEPYKIRAARDRAALVKQASDDEQQPRATVQPEVKSLPTPEVGPQVVRPAPAGKTPHQLSPDSPAAQGTFEERRALLQRIIASPREKDLPAAWRILSNGEDPLSPTAALAVGRIGGPEAERALLAAAGDRRADVRAAVLEALVSCHSAQAAPLCRKALGKGASVAERETAAHALGELRDRESLPRLREMMVKESPRLQAPAAWSLACMGEDDGLAYLGRLAGSGDPHIAPLALRLLGDVPRRDAVLLLLDGLFAPDLGSAVAASETLEKLDAQWRISAIASLPADKQELVNDRRALLLAAQGQGKMPEHCLDLAVLGAESEKKLALSAIAYDGGLRCVPAVITIRDAREREVRESARRILTQLIEKHGLAHAPAEDALQAEWRVWWLGQYRIAAAGADSATLLLPDGRRTKVRGGSTVDWGCAVTSIFPGKGENGVKGAVVNIQSADRNVRLEGF